LSIEYIRPPVKGGVKVLVATIIVKRKSRQ
jgi:hypothetical protein